MRYRFNSTALMTAAYFDHENAVLALIQAGADIHLQDDNKLTALAQAYGRARLILSNPSLIQRMLAGGKGINYKSLLSSATMGSVRGNSFVVITDGDDHTDYGDSKVFGKRKDYRQEKSEL
jgi:hypothetical protein